MKSHLFLLSLSAAGAFAQTQFLREAQYNAICAYQDGLEDEISPGYWVRYNCGVIGSWASPTISNIQSAQACAEECKQVATCVGSSWSATSAQCVLSGNKKSINRSYSLFMEKIEPADPFETCEDTLDTCQADLAQSKADAAKSQAALTKCQSDKQKLDLIWEQRKEAMEICGYGGRTKIQAGKYAYTPRCQRSATTGAFYKQLDLSVDKCLQQCSKETRCKSVNYVIMNNAPCKLHETGTTAAIPVTDENSCPVTPMIGFTPTTKK
ncbi:hypothetical protein N7494_000436 [Penicillium frequentans]|uniref:Apple domain-containing protein n=1 Tax=Penicillium frequentans TaxID=3151616 RepID=A0AAD6D617_9EURO|nr:hypothetical protein N7494_000436 [Penicillium glabrum]